jgi:hypothetical protein
MFRRRDRRDGVDAPDDIGAVDDGAQVEPGDRPEDMTADLEAQAADYLADNDVWMYGPNAVAVIEILDRIEDIGPQQARPLAEAWLAIPKSDRDRARKAASKLAETDAELARHLQLVREAVGTWMAVTGPYPEFVNAEPDWSRICAQTGEAALDAATAVILEGKLEEHHYEALLEPWSETMAQLEAAVDAAKLEGAQAEETDEDDEAEEDEAEGEFGPNSDTITDFLNRLWLLTPEQVGRLVGGWQNADRDDLKTAHESLRALAEEDPEWREQVRHAQEKLTPWLNAGRIQETAGFLGQAGQGESRKMAGPALADAIAALVLADLLDRPDAEAMYGPWFNLIGAPSLPVVDDDEAEAPKGTDAKPPKSVPKSGAKSGKAGTATKTATGGKAGTATKTATGGKAKGNQPVANQLRGGAKPNVLKKK